MCRLLYVKNTDEFGIPDYLNKFAEVCRTSKEYQGHGWGCAYLQEGEWRYYKNILPVWEDDLTLFGNTELLIVHARSAFQDKDIFVENNMPFYDDNFVFIFNGELRGVKIKAEGRIGAEKIFNYIKRFYKGDMNEAFVKSTAIIKEKSDYIRAMNIIITDKEKVYVCSFFNEDPEYFTLNKKYEDGGLVVCSAPLDQQNDWEKIPNNFIGELHVDN